MAGPNGHPYLGVTITRVVIMRAPAHMRALPRGYGILLADCARATPAIQLRYSCFETEQTD